MRQGTREGETIRGTARDDKIYGGFGNDTIRGVGGNDQVYADRKKNRLKSCEKVL